MRRVKTILKKRRLAVRAAENPDAEIMVKRKRHSLEITTIIPREECADVEVDSSGERIVQVGGTGGVVSEQTWTPAQPTSENIKKIWNHLLVKEVRSRCPEVLGMADLKHVLFHGKTQSGKGTLQFVMMWYYSFILNKKVVHLLDNRRASLKQNVERDYKKVRDIIQEACTSCGITDWQNYMYTYSVAGERNPVPRGPHAVSVAIGNPTRIRQLVSQVEREKGIVIVIDECDVFVKSHDGHMKTEVQLKRLKEHADHMVMFTATPFANYAQEDTRVTLFKMKESPTYRDIRSEKIEKRILPPEFFGQRMKFKNIKELLRDVIFPHDFGHLQNITLVNVESMTSSMDALARVLRVAFKDTFHCVVHHSHTKMHFKGEQFESHDIKGLFEAIEKNTDGKPIVIVSGQMAGRAVTFRSQTGGISQLTSMIYHPSASASEVNIQQAQRINGNYSFDIPNMLFFATQKTVDVINVAINNTLRMNDTITDDKDTLECISTGIYEHSGRHMDRAGVEGHLEKETDSHPEFETLDALRQYFRGHYRKEVCITEKYGQVQVPSFKYEGNDAAEQARIRRNTLHEISANYPHLETTRGGVQFCWDEDRYRRVFNTGARRTDKNYQKSVYVLGRPAPGVHTTVPFILYKPEYHDASRCTEDYTLYVCQTTAGTWRGYVPNMKKHKSLRIRPRNNMM
jgi:hypothetical protein